ncbi:MAG TPA: PAS domain S-box protein [bacterium]|nr:PAS domain S-box protein [bacterium]HPN43027.1 PAS domain S-box protein [bacterium]
MKTVKPHIVLVEDEIIIAQDLKRNLINMGYNVPAIVFTGEEALVQAEALMPSLVLMDIKLRGKIDGIEAAGEIQKKHNIPVIYITANADHETVERASKTEPYGFIYKPIQLSVLRTTIDMALYKHSMEKQLREREIWLNATLHSIGDAVIATDTKNRITLMNSVAEELTGWKQEECSGAPLNKVFRIIDKHNRETVVYPITRVIQSGLPTSLNIETLLLSKDGRQFQIADRTTVIRDTKGTITGAVLVFRDVTQEQRIEQSLEEKEHRLRNIIESTPLGMHIYELKDDGRLLFTGANPAADRILGVDHNIFIGKTIEEAFPPLTETEVPTRYKEAAQSGKYWKTQQINYEDNKIKGAYEVHAFQTSPGKMVAMFEDITERKKIEAELYLKDRAIASSFNAVIIFDLQGNITWINDAFSKMWGYSREEAVKFKCIEMAADKEAATIIFNDLKAKGTSLGELLAQRCDGSSFYTQYYASIVKNDSNDPIAFLVICVDITERKQAEQAIRVSEERLAFALTAVNDAIWDFKPQQGLLYWSPRYYTMLGYEPDEFKPSIENWRALLHPDDIMAAETALADCLKGFADDYSQECRLRDKNNNYRWILVRGKVVKKDSNGQVLRMSGTHTDITERKLDEEALKQSEERYRNFMTNATEGIYRIDFTHPVPVDQPYPELEKQFTDYAFVAEVNKALAAMYGLQPEEMVGRMVRDFAPNCGSQIGALVLTPDYKIIDRVEKELKDDGSPFYIMESYTGVVENGILKRVWGVQRDITERKKAEEQIQRALAEKDIMLKEIHHRVKNNMNVITSLLNLQAERIETREQAKAAFEESRNRVYSMALVHDQLYKSADFSSIDMKPYIFTLVQKLQQAYVADKKINLDLKVLNAFLNVNIAVPCGLILNELITNVFKHAFQDRKTGNLIVYFQPYQDSMYELQVQDDGAGLPSDFNIHSLTTLGLKLVTILTEQIDGVLEIKRDAGTTFIIRFKN